MENLTTEKLIEIYNNYFNQWIKNKTIKNLSEFESVIIELTNREKLTN
jgi:hypothetical protein